MPDIVIAGGGIAGLTAALALAARGFPSRVVERAPELSEVGAGLQLSPNAVKILHRLGLEPALSGACSRPAAVIIRDARSLRPMAHIPLEGAEARWGAPYLVAHRADLQKVLADKVTASDGIALETGTFLDNINIGRDSMHFQVISQWKTSHGSANLLVGADGVWSQTRSLARGRDSSEFSGHVAWRVTLPATASGANAVNVYAHRDIHVVSYPLRHGTLVNFVAVARGPDLPRGWESKTDCEPLRARLRQLAPELARLADAAWTAWPIHTVARPVFGNGSNIALIGDAAHAMTPFAAQGAAMAIEDAWVLADALARSDGKVDAAIQSYEGARLPRIGKVKRRAALNHFAWHAWGPVAYARDMVLKLKGPERLARDLDWLYGWEIP